MNDLDAPTLRRSDDATMRRCDDATPVLRVDFLRRGRIQIIQLADAPGRGDAWQEEKAVPLARIL